MTPGYYSPPSSSPQPRTNAQQDHETPDLPLPTTLNLKHGTDESDDIELAPTKGATSAADSSFVIDQEFENMVNDIVPCTDDPSLPTFSIRVWILGSLFCIMLGIANTIFAFRTNYFSLSPFICTLLAYPLGVFLAYLIPRYKVTILGLDIDTNPGPFSVKEHVLIGIFGTTGASGVYASSNLVVQEVYYEFYMQPVWAICFLIASSALGFGISGLLRKYLVRPSHMIWPTVLPSVALYTAFHSVQIDALKKDGRKHLSQLTVFGIGAVAMFAYHILGPGYLMTMLTNLPLVCFIFPASDTLMQRLGSPTWGVGMFSFVTDWTYIGSTSMSIPFWSAVNQICSVLIFHYVVTPLLWHYNSFNQPPFTLNTTRLIDKNGSVLEASQVVDHTSHALNVPLYQSRAPIHMSSFFAIGYFSNFTTICAAITHTVVWYGKDIMNRFHMSREDEEVDDIHCQLIDNYLEVPSWWYYGFFMVTFAMMLVTGQFSGMDFPWWASILATVLAIIATVPIAVVAATSGVTLYLNVIAQFTIGMIMPGYPIIMMAFKALCFSVSSQCMTMLMDLKLGLIGHYLKVPPRDIFIAQLVSQIMAAFVVFYTQLWWMTPEHIAWIKADGKDEGIGRNWGSSQWHNVYYAASLIWGAIGPKRFFFDTQYSVVIYSGIIVGTVFPILLKTAHRYTGASWLVLIHPVLFLNPPGAGGNQGVYLSSFAISFISQYVIYRYRAGFWKRYNYVLACSFDAGAAIAVVCITFILPEAPTWFLNCIAGESCDPSVQGTKGDWCHLGDVPLA